MEYIEWSPTPGVVLTAGPVPGLDYAASAVIIPPPAITPRQLCLALLLEWGVFEEDVSALIAQIPDQFARDLADIEWRKATFFLRDNPMVLQIGTALGKTPAQIDTAWARAVTL